MAKRPLRSQADDTGTVPSDPKPRRARAAQTAPPAPGAPVPPTQQGTRAAASDERSFDPGSRPEALDRSDDLSSESTSMASEPSEQDIRTRAYHRYLERGGGDGGEFNDWVEAERELKVGR